MPEPVRGSASAQASPDQTYLVKLVDTEEGLRSLAGEWDALLAQTERPSPFLGWDWIFTWWQHFHHGSRLCIATVRDREGRLAGIAPLHIVRRRALGVAVRSLEFLGYRGGGVCADHLDFIAAPDGKQQILGALVEALLRLSGWDVMVLADLREDSKLPEVWRKAEADLEMETRAGEVCHYLPLAKTAEAFWREMQGSHPQMPRNIRRCRRRLEQRFRVEFRAEAPAAEIPKEMENLARLHGMSRTRRREPSKFDHAPYRRFHDALVQRLADKGKLYLARLECGDRTVAAFYGIVEAGVLNYYQSGFDTSLERYGVGKLLMAAVMEDAISRLGVREFDFLRGGETYKSRWTSHARRTFYLYGWRRKAAARWDRMTWLAWQKLGPLRRWGGAFLGRERAERRT